MSKNDYLTEDSLLPDGQKFVCISFLSDPENKVTLSGIKVRGVFNDIKSASDHAKNVQNVDPAHNVFVGEMGKWLAYDPDTNSEAAGNAEYANEQLNNIMKGYLENQEKSKLFHEKRKYEAMKKSLDEAIETSTKSVKDIQQQILESKDENNTESLSSKLESINKQIDELTMKRDEHHIQETKYDTILNKNQQSANLSI